MALMGIKQVPFVHSSLDFSNGQPNKAVVHKDSMPDVIHQMTALAEKRQLVLAKKECADDSHCTVVFKRNANVDKAKTEGSITTNTGYGSQKSTVQGETTTYNISFSSRIYADLAKTGNGVEIQMMGVPVVKDTLACPQWLEARKECTPQLFNVQGDQTPEQSFKGLWGVDISGHEESDMINGILAELD